MKKKDAVIATVCLGIMWVCVAIPSFMVLSNHPFPQWPSPIILALITSQTLLTIVVMRRIRPLP